MTLTYLWPLSALLLSLLVSCCAHVSASDTADLYKESPVFNDPMEDTGVDVSNFRNDLEEQNLLQLKEEVQDLRDRWLAMQALTGGQEVDKRYKPSGFLGSRGKRFIPGLESLLLARIYHDNFYDEKWKRQPHSGFHASRG